MQWKMLLELSLGMAAYAVILVASLLLLGRGDVETPHAVWRVAVSLAPMLPAIAVCWAVVRGLRRLDEMQRRLQLEALGMAFAGTALITFAYGFLENVGFPRLTMFAVWPLMAALWILGGAIAGRRYR